LGVGGGRGEGRVEKGNGGRGRVGEKRGGEGEEGKVGPPSKNPGYELTALQGAGMYNTVIA